MKLLLRDIDTSMLGLEVAPWFNPIVPKSGGYNVHTLDVFDFDTLMERAHENKGIPPESYGKLEPVDYVGSATEILSLVPKDRHGQFDYVISSHNFEHLPNPIKFLQGCETLLREGGMIVMALPDGRACFDYFRPHTITADWLEAYAEDRKQPSERQLFAGQVDFASVKGRRNDPDTAVGFDTPRDMIENHADLPARWAEWTDRKGTGPYMDAHCTVMTPASLQLMLEDCRALGLFSLDVKEVTSTTGVEFIIRLVKGDTSGAVNPEAYQARRTQLLHDIWHEQAVRFMSRRYGTGALAEAFMNIRADSGVFERFKHFLKCQNRLRLARRRSRQKQARS